MERATPTRLLSLDVFRGATIAGMLLVNDPGSWSDIYRPFAHAEWNGWTPADLIFPFFLFIVGITTELSLSARRARGADDRAIVRQILRRGALIVLLGLIAAAFPFFPATRFTDIRFPGVLQRIGVAYICGAVLTLRTTVKQQVLIIVALLYGYWFAMTLLPVPGHGLGALMLDMPDATLSAWLDRIIFGQHLWVLSKTWDPEGLLSTVPAVATVMLGVLTGRWLMHPSQGIAPAAPTGGIPSEGLADRLNALFAVGGIAMILGLMWGWSFPINKSLWTSSYVLFTAGMAAIALAASVWIIDVKRIDGWSRPFVIFGTNPMIAFVGSAMFARLIYSVVKVPFHGKSTSIQSVIYQTAFASWLPPNDASLAFAVCIVLFWLAILTILYRKKIFLKV